MSVIANLKALISPSANILAGSWTERRLRLSIILLTDEVERLKEKVSDYEDKISKLEAKLKEKNEPI